LQTLRAVVGHWARELAETELSVRLPDPADPAKAIETLRQRGETWEFEGKAPVSDVLAALFINPMKCHRNDDRASPDSPLLADNHSRSAILFGPPGTSKTTLVESIAGALGWSYLEIHASSFVVNGMESVHQRADWIFSRIMELDRCVVLFDEIDELVREREDRESHVYSRFLTTSMLPKIAELWKQRRVLYFVATNSFKYFDFAIARNQRFDARLFVAPPSFEKKLKELRAYADVKINQNKVEKALQDGRANLGLLALLRFDQLPELGRRLKAQAAGKETYGDLLDECLAEFRTRIAESYPPENFQKDRRRTDRDQQRIAVVVFDRELGAESEIFRQHFVDGKQFYYSIDDPWTLNALIEGDGWRATKVGPASYHVEKRSKATN
jgi:SpoVK/Ycf46/Vps4 family AAA+-type ATPase